MVAGCIILLFVWAYFTDIHHISQTLFGGTIIAGLAGLTVATATVSYRWAPPNYQTVTAYAAYILLVATTGMLVINTGGGTSPFVALWMITTIFAGLFGTASIVVLFVVINAYLLYLLVTGDLTNNLVQTLVMAGELPLIVSYILWHSKARSDTSKERAYYDLANELNQVSNKAEVVINAIADGVIAINNQGTIELINPAAQRIVGWGRQDAIGLDYKSVLQLLGKDGHELDKATDPVFSVLTTNQQKRVKDLLLQTNSGKRISVAVVASPTGHMGSGAIIVFRDITKETAEEREQAEFISTASHEMRTPVAAIEGYLGLALNPQTASIDEKAREFIGKAQESAQHLGRLFQDLLDVSKADDGRLSNNPKVIDIVQFTKSIIDDLQPKAKQKELRIFYKPLTSDANESAGLPSVSPIFYSHIDADHLREVLSNLIENAIKYTPAGEVAVDVSGDNEHIVVSIADSGIGIPAEDIPHLFQKFYRVDNSDTREIGGTGLGLYLCRKLVEAMAGRIWVESEYKHGSTFFVEIPRISHDEANRLIEASVETDSAVTSHGYVSSPDGRTPSEHITPALNDTVLLQHKPTNPVSESSTETPKIISLHPSSKPVSAPAQAASTQPVTLVSSPAEDAPQTAPAPVTQGASPATATPSQAAPVTPQPMALPNPPKPQSIPVIMPLSTPAPTAPVTSTPTPIAVQTPPTAASPQPAPQTAPITAVPPRPAAPQFAQPVPPQAPPVSAKIPEKPQGL